MECYLCLKFPLLKRFLKNRCNNDGKRSAKKKLRMDWTKTDEDHDFDDDEHHIKRRKLSTFCLEREALIDSDENIDETIDSGDDGEDESKPHKYRTRSSTRSIPSPAKYQESMSSFEEVNCCLFDIVSCLIYVISTFQSIRKSINPGD